MYPKDEGFFMPAEWEERERTFMEWPCREEIWFDGILEAKQGYANIAKAIAEFEPIVMIVNKEDEDEARKMCGEKVEILVIEHDDSWVRDNGPTFIKNKDGELRGINWKFNSWGEKYLPYDKDDQVAKKLLNHYGVKSYDAPFVLEGGSIHVDGEGTLLTTEECLLNKNRNPHLTKKDIEDYLNKYLSIEKFIWLKRGLFGDETDGHVDNVACFAKPGVVVLQVCYDKNDPNYEITQENLEILRNFVDAKGRKLEIVEIEQPPARYMNGERLTLSYLNYYPVNGGIILPTFGGDAKEYDLKAKEILEKVYPDRKVVMIDGMPIIKGGGNVHCITQQMPKGVIK
ncbi:MAG: agmatine deiminase [Fusobacteriaceae bacterium]|nr:agmatine deiminase [Fusobacteriaceae bacterium]